MIEWTSSPELEAIVEGMPENIQVTAQRGIVDVYNLCLKAEEFLRNTYQGSESEVAERRTKGKGKLKLDALDRLALRELGETERDLIAVKTNVEANAALGEGLADAIVAGIKATQNTDEMAEIKAQVKALAEQNAKLAAQLNKQSEPSVRKESK
jgi:hypothetical protein